MRNVKMVRVNEQINKEIQLLKLENGLRSFNDTVEFLLDMYEKLKGQELNTEKLSS